MLALFKDSWEEIDSPLGSSGWKNTWIPDYAIIGL